MGWLSFSFFFLKNGRSYFAMSFDFGMSFDVTMSFLIFLCLALIVG